MLLGFLFALLASDTYKVSLIPSLATFDVPRVYGVDDAGNPWGSVFIDVKQGEMFCGSNKIDIQIPDGVSWLEPTYLNPAGVLVGSMYTDRDDGSGFVLRNGKVSPLGPLGNHPFMGALSVNQSGVAVGWSGTAAIWAAHESTKQSAVVWSTSNPRQLILPKDWKFPVATAINDVGVIVGYATLGKETIFWEIDNEEVRVMGSGEFKPVAINANGEVAGNTEVDGHARAAVWRNGTITVLPPVAGFPESKALAISDNGTVVGTSAFEFEFLGDGPISASSYQCHATVWKGEVPIDLNRFASGMKRSTILMKAVGINKAGTIVGETSINLEVRRRAVVHMDSGTFIATPN